MNTTTTRGALRPLPSRLRPGAGQRAMLPDADGWIEVRDGDRRALTLYEQHYSAHRYADGRARRLFMGPGEKMALVTADGLALFAWRLFHSDAAAQNDADGRGLNCAVFRNAGPRLSSDLILAAETRAWARWPGRRLYTYVNAACTSQRRSRHSEPTRRAFGTPGGHLRAGRRADS